MTGSGLRSVTDDQASVLGGTAPATGTHTLVVNGTALADSIKIAGGPVSTTVSGLVAAVGIVHDDPATASLAVNGLAGADAISAAGMAAGGVPLTINGGDDDDTITGGAGGDVISGGRAHDPGGGGAGQGQFFWEHRR